MVYITTWTFHKWCQMVPFFGVNSPSKIGWSWPLEGAVVDIPQNRHVFKWRSWIPETHHLKAIYAHCSRFFLQWLLTKELQETGSMMLQAVWNEKIYAHFSGGVYLFKWFFFAHAPNMMGNETCQAGIGYDEDTSVPLSDGDLVVIDHCK